MKHEAVKNCFITKYNCPVNTAAPYENIYTRIHENIIIITLNINLKNKIFKEVICI